MDKNETFVSIALLTYNRKDCLERSINSILKQTHKNFELLINDDRSSDQTEEICRKFESQDTRVKYYKNKVNRKYAGNSNEAIIRAKSEFVAIVHDGDEYDETMIEKWVKKMVQYPSSSLAFCGNYVMNHSWEIDKTNIHNYPEFSKGKDLLREMLLRFASPIWGIVMVRKSSIIQLGYFDETKPRLTDVDMWLRLLKEYDVVYINEPLIKIAPRELNHENAGVNWKIFEEIVDIRKKNILINKIELGENFMFYKRKFNADLFRMYLKYLLSCIKRKKIKLLFIGLQSITLFAKKRI